MAVRKKVKKLKRKVTKKPVFIETRGRPESLPHLKTKSVAARLPLYVREHLDELSPNMSQLILEAVTAHYNIKAPK